MKLIIALLFLSFGVLSYGQNEADTTCNIDNYRDYIYTPGNYKCNLRGANLYGADLRRANLRNANLRLADLRGANLVRANLRDANFWWVKLDGAKVDPSLGAYLTLKNQSGFIVVEDE